MIDLLTSGLWSGLAKQVGQPHLWILSLGFIILGFGYRAWRSRIRRGDYEFSAKGTDLIFESELGTFIFSKDKRSFTAHYGKKEVIVVGFDDIRNIDIITEDIDAMFSEMAFEDWDFLIDTLPEYRDVVKRYSIAVVTKNFQRFPLIYMSQYTVKDFMAWGLQMQLDLLSLVGLYIPIDMFTQKIYGEFKQSLSQEFSFDRDKLPYHFDKQ